MMIRVIRVIGFGVIEVSRIIRAIRLLSSYGYYNY